MKPVFILLFTAAVACGQSALRGPVAGHIFDSRNGTIRPVLGIPGSAHVGAPLPGPALAWAFPAPGGNFAFAGTAAAPGDVLLLLDLNEQEPVAKEVARLTEAPRRVAFGSSGDCAVLGGAPGSAVLTVSGIAQAPIVTTATLPAGADEISAIATDARCSKVVVASEGRLYRSAVAGDPLTELVTLGAVSGVVLDGEGRAAFVAALDLRQIVRVDDVFGEARLSVLAGGSDGVTRPAGLALVDSLLLVADAGARTLFTFNAQLSELRRAEPLGFEPNRCELINRDGTVVLTGGGGPPLWVIDSRAGGLIAFIPFE
ncbi:MAG: hypothetical protein JNN08_25150 [Bryobacterales bacterium]|nr:hypothetical protein [Bryobacterales bacterium]